ncbi:hypothetical protein PJ985_14775 [Streptomyces sp. ACA25]|uniref:hypothetical protein n=1 Tax=Streptomyces sp. ACA25 TaxID=3022596 RepID=UPI002307553B|nr:hypothetical protein [Streptomyces sp. ACA25]MDB1088830.1 hypothetical protein [Streptomyces sp. ACA25]
MIEVGNDGAFRTNSVGTDRSPFPLSFTACETDGWWQISASAAQADELTDVLSRSANDTVLLVDLATVSFLHEDLQQWRPSLIAAEQGVDFTAHPLGAWASGTPGLGDEILVMHRNSLPRFLDGSWSPYELTLVDVPAVPGPARLDEIALIMGTAATDEPVLPRLKGSGLWYSGHDDCYLAVETADPTVPASILNRLLALLAGSALAGARATSSVVIPEPDVTTTGRLIGESPHWIGVVAAASETSVTIELSALPQPWQLGEQPPEHVDCTATLDLTRGAWRVALPPGSAL